MFRLQIDPWDQIRSFQISTLYTNMTLKEEGEYVAYEMYEYGRREFIEYKFRVVKRDNYKEYVKMLMELDVDVLSLKDLVGVLSYFRDVYQHALGLVRKGLLADVTFRWRDGDIIVSYTLYASKGGEEADIQSKLSAEFGSEYINFLHGETSPDIDEKLERHTQYAIGLYSLFKEYVLQGKV